MKKFIPAGVALIILTPHLSAAEPTLSNRSIVRIQSASIEGGWHSGRLQLDAQKCWMVKLDNATRDNYTMLSLVAVDQLQVTDGNGWTAVSIKPVLQASPDVCREYGAD